jgi:hypothetical protein
LKEECRRAWEIWWTITQIASSIEQQYYTISRIEGNGGELKMGMSKLSIWVRDTAHPCLPYQSTGHSFYAIIWTCDLQPLSFGRVKNGLFPLTDLGAGGGRVHGQVEVPPGCYIVVAYATCKNVFTDFAMVQVGCNDEACVNLLTKSATTCLGVQIVTLKIAQYLGPNYNPASPAGREIPKEVLANAIASLEKLRTYLPEDTITPRLVSLDELMKLADIEKQKNLAEKEKQHK